MLSKCLTYRICMGRQRHSIVYHGEWNKHTTLKCILTWCVLENKEEIIMPRAEGLCKKRLGPHTYIVKWECL